MKKYFAIFLFLCFRLTAQVSTDQNYVLTTVPTSEVTVPNQTTATYTKQQSVQYFDGLGRIIQKNQIGATPDGKDLVQPIVYDQYGRKTKDYLPYPTTASGNGVFILNPIPSLNSFYQVKFPEEVMNGMTNPYSEIAIEPSPLRRVQEVGAPGKDWKLSQFAQISSVGTYTYSWSYTSFVNGYVPGGNPVQFTLNSQGLLSMVMNFGGPGFTLKVGNIQYIGNLPDTNLGYITDIYGVNTSYYASIKNGYFFVASTQQETITSVKTTFAHQFDMNYVRLSSGNTLKYDSKTNSTSDVKKYAVTLDANRKPSLAYGGYYAANNLAVTVTKDENWKATYHEEWDYHDFLTSAAMTSSGENIVIDVSGNSISLSVNMNFYPWYAMKTGAVKTLPIQVSDVTLGYLTYSGSNVYKVYIADNVLYIDNVYSGSGIQGANFNTTLTANATVTLTANKNNSIEEYTDKYGRLVLSRKFNNNVAHDTYYVYDPNNNLAYIISPLADEEVISMPQTQGGIYSTNQTVVDELCYVYWYDIRNRMVEKKLPGKDWQKIVYDKLNRPLLTQDANQRAQNIWIFTKYDKHGRVVYTGTYTDSRAREVIQAEQDAVFDPVLFESRTSTSFANGGANIHYTNNVFPTTGAVLSVNYFDDYNFDKVGIIVPAATSYHALATNVKGMATGTKVRILNTNLWSTTVLGYDVKGRKIWSRNKDAYMSTETIVETKLNFNGLALQNKTQHVRSGIPTVTVYDFFAYDNTGRLLKHSQKVNSNDEELIAYNKYDELGRLVQKKVGGISNPGTTYADTPGLQTIDYSYNIRGWLKSVNEITQNLNASGSTDLFAYRINYNTVTGTTFTGVQASPMYNGSISDITWKSKIDNRLRVYAYKYDALDRLIDANLFTNYNPGPGPVYNYREGPVTYDKNSNILSLERNGLKANNVTVEKIDILDYNYMPNSNKLLSVTDASDTAGFNNGVTGSNTDYDYDANGNMVKDLNKGIGTAAANGIEYNPVVNLPSKITFSANDYIEYVYDATGYKVAKKVVTAGNVIVTQYIGGFVYQKVNSGTNSLQMFFTPEGYVKKSSTGIFSHVFQFKDHLGNVRLSYTDANNDEVITAAEIIEEFNYYPFGMQHKGYNNNLNTIGNDNAQKYRYNGKEFQDELSLDLYDYGARNYDPVLGKWLSMDPLAEKLPFTSPFTYCLNNPIIMVDPDGQYPWPFWVRSFISSSTAGGGTFRGDGRGVSSSLDVTSRVNYNFTYDGQKKTISQGAFYSDFTLKYPQLLPSGGVIPAIIKTATPHRSVGEVQHLPDGDGGSIETYGFHYWAKDPITPQSLTPALDVHGSLILSEDLDKGILSINGDFSGDTFPSTEAFVVDQSGNKLFLGAHKEQGSVFTLVGDSQTPIFSVDMQVKFDNKGNFTGVIQGDKTISVDSWNSQVQESFNR